MKKIKQFLTKHNIHWYYFAAVFGGFFIVFYVLQYIVPYSVEFSYAEPTCAARITAFPDIEKANASDQFTLSYRGGFTLFDTRLLATETCFMPVDVPRPGVTHLASAPFGGPLFRHTYKLAVGAQPSVTSTLPTTPISRFTKLEFMTNRADRIFTYAMTSGEISQPCESNDQTISCAIDKLNLKQGAKHTLSLTRSFGDTPVDSITSGTITILPATTVKKVSVKENETLYTKPQEFTVAFDKPLKSANATLALSTDEGTQNVAANVQHKGATLTLKVDDKLPRNATYKLTVTEAIASDSSTLEKPHTTTFKTSGGPQVTSVNIGGGGVSTNATIVVKFDQKINAADVEKLASVRGVSARITAGERSVVYQLRGAERCKAFTLSVKKGIAGSENDEKSTGDWSHSSRTNCQLTTTIGRSVQGRAITAHYFGSGNKTILFTGGIHGSEPSGTSTMQSMVDDLAINAHKIPTNTQVVVIPNLNPDGSAMGTRLNARRVNLDRNFPTQDWSRNIDTANGILKNGGGKKAGSEPETQAIMQLVQRLNVYAQISFHAQGSLVGANGTGFAYSIGNTYASTVGYRTMFGHAEETMGYAITGEYEAWLSERGVPAILIELPSSHGSYYSSNSSAIWKMINL